MISQFAHYRRFHDGETVSIKKDVFTVCPLSTKTGFQKDSGKTWSRRSGSYFCIKKLLLPILTPARSSPGFIWLSPILILHRHFSGHLSSQILTHKEFHLLFLISFAEKIIKFCDCGFRGNIFSAYSSHIFESAAGFIGTQAYRSLRAL